MKITLTQQIWTAFKIWLVAVIANMLLGTTYLARHNDEITMFLMLGAFWGALFSLPVFLAILLIINRGVASAKTGRWIFNAVLVSGVLFTGIVFTLFRWWFGKMPARESILLVIAVLSGIIGIVTQYKSLVKAGSDFQSSKISYHL